jgi:hypothetical protein
MVETWLTGPMPLAGAVHSISSRPRTSRGGLKCKAADSEPTNARRRNHSLGFLDVALRQRLGLELGRCALLL